MEKRRLVNKTEMGKENFKRISSKQLEARITVFTVILAVIVMNILWWTTLKRKNIRCRCSWLEKTLYM